MKVTTEYIEQLINKYGDTALRVAFTYLKNRADAEDAVQDAFLRIIDKTPEIAKITGSGEATARSPLRQDLQSAYRFRGLCTDLSHRGTSRSRSLNPR